MNFIVIALGALYATLETSFFGWNVFPQSTAELMADGIAVVILAIGIAK